MDHFTSNKIDELFDNYYYKEVATLLGAGGWSVDFINKKSYIDPAARSILKLSNDFKPSLYSLAEFYPEGEHREKAIETFIACSNGVSFNTTVKMITTQGQEFWVQAMGKPTYNDSKEIIGIHGVFVDINVQKTKEIEIEKSMKIIASQNEKLQNFAHIVSHNLRSHTSNLQLTLELLKMAHPITENEEEETLRDMLFEISKNLNNTITHLNEIVTIQNIVPRDLKNISFTEVFNRVEQSLTHIIKATHASIFTDFNEVKEIPYIEAYLESILHNLVSNALKYKHPDRDPSIHIVTFLKDEKPCLLVRDNGLGIDMEQYGQKLFNIYQTFHYNEDAQGVGLFMTKSQVEALGGTIYATSELNKNTTFTIEF